MLLRRMALVGRQQLHARYFSQKMVSGWPEGIKKFLEREKIEKPTLIQERTLPIAMNNKNLVGTARGSGKTPASVIPAVMKILKLRGDTTLTNLKDESQGKWNNMQQVRCFHAKGSKVRYLDFRYRFNTCHLRSHLLIIRRQKMKKHQKRKWRKKYKSVIAKMRLKREIAKEKTFRVELLTMIKRAEQFDPREYALKKIQEINSRPIEITREERLEQLKELIRKNRYQVSYVKPKHRRIEV